MAKIVKFTETGRADGDKRPLYIRPDRIDVRLDENNVIQSLHCG